MAMDMARDLGLILPEMIVVLTGVLTLVVGMLKRHAWAMPLTVSGNLLAAALTLPLIGEDTTVFMGTLRIDDLSVWAKIVLLPTTALVAILAVPEIRGTDRESTVYALFSLTTVGALALASAGDVMFLVLGTLISSLGSFPLVAYPRDDRATEAAMKYFVFGSVTSAVMIFGLTFWLGGTGSTLLSDLDQLGDRTLAAAMGLVAVTVGLGYKAALAPFHFWAPDAYDGAPVVVAAYLSIVPKIGAIFGLAVIGQSLPADIVDWRLLFAVLAAVSMTYGNLAALVQTDVVRLLAYSSIAQAGYFLLGVVAVGRDALAVESLVIFGAAYAAMNLGAFAIVCETGRDLGAFLGLGRARPWTGVGMTIFLLSLVGIPPLAGFFGKLLLFGAAIEAGFTWLAVIGILNSVVSLAVYLRIVVPMYRPAGRSTPREGFAAIVWAIALVITLALGPLLEPLTGALGG
jgi:NADH-quinone oxidoreductase subunit N